MSIGCELGVTASHLAVYGGILGGHSWAVSVGGVL